MGRFLVTSWLTAMCVLLTTVQAAAAVKLPSIFTDNMVLQRDKAVPIWGKADPAEEVKVTFAGQTKSVKADDKGNWMVRLDPQVASGEGRELTVNDKKYKNVVVGDVWICSGQSNMEFAVGGCLNKQEEFKNANYPLIRHIKFSHVTADTPVFSPRASTWIVCSPRTVGGFTAAGYFFGRRLFKELNVPIGLIGTNWGGTRVEPWVAPEGFAMVPELAKISEKVQKCLPTTEAGKAAYLKTVEDMKAWLPQVEAAINDGTTIPEMPKFPVTGSDNRSPCRIFNAMIKPIVPYGIRGAIWYQGESNGNEGESYFQKKKALIEGWRKIWNQGDFPFYFVQLADYRQSPDDPAGGDGWAKLREAQRKTLTLKNTGMAVIIDIGNARDIHPKNKQDVGDRLAQWALAKEFGKDIVPSGPLYKGITVEGNKIRVAFDNVGGGLMVGKKEGLKPTAEDTATPLKQFSIAGKDKKWYWADAKIDGDTVVVSSDKVAEPVAVRYAFRMNPVGANLYNKEGIPASPFRSDNW